MMRNAFMKFESMGLVLACVLTTSNAFLSGAPPLFSKQLTNLRDAQQLNMETIDNSPLKEIDEEFLRNCQVDTTIQNLRNQLPRLLVKALDAQNVESVYSSDVALTGPRGEELALGREEFVSLSSTLVAATAAARQANAFVTRNTNTTSIIDKVDCKMAMDASLDKLRVEWKADLPIIGTQQRESKLVGLSDLILDEDGKVCEHKILDVRLDGRTISAIGETLATLRRVARTFGDSPLLMGIRDSPLTATLLSDIRNGLLQQQQQIGGLNESSLSIPPLYLMDSVDSAFNSTSKDQNMTLIDDIVTTSPPLPGSMRWTSFAASRQAIARFLEYGLPGLSGKGFSTKQDFEQLFASDAKLKGVNGEVLASGGERIASFYRTMASLRKGTLSGDWKIAQVSTDFSSRNVIVKWIATVPIRIEGRDRFQLCDSETEPVIEAVEQLELKINGNRVLDTEWVRSFLTTIETGRGNMGVDMVVDLLQQAGGKQPLKSTPSLNGPPRLKTEAAASFYGILCAFHRDLPTLTDINPQSPPAAEYLASNIELRGYLDEILAKGSSSYTQVANVLTASLRTALLTGRVTAESPPSPKIEFKSDGSIRVSLLVNLRVKVTSGESDLGVPLKLELVSEYKVNGEGKIKEHKLVESRVNGQLTPGDVLSRWIKGTTSDTESSTTSLLDVLSWARTFSGNNRRQ